MPTSFTGGSYLPPVGSDAYRQAQQGSGYGSYDPGSGTLSTGDSGSFGAGYFPDGTPIRNYNQVGAYFGNDYAGFGGGGVFSAPSYWGANLGFDVSKLTPTPSVNVPQQNPTIGSISGVDGQMSYFNEIDKELKKRADEARKAAMALKESEKVKEEKGLLAKLMGGPSRQEVMQQATAQSGLQQYESDVAARSAEIGTLTQQYNKTLAARDQQIAQTQDKFASTNFISNQVAQINRNAAPVLNQIAADINAKTAMMQVSQGQIQNAQKYIAQMVDAVTADRKDTYDMYVRLQSENEQVYNSLKSEYKEAYNSAMGNARDAWTYARQEATKVGQLMLDNPQAGITPQDTFDEALMKVQRNPKAVKPDIFGGQSTGYGAQVYDPRTGEWSTEPVATGSPSSTSPSPAPVKITSSQLNSGSSLLGVTPEAFKALDPQIQIFFTNSGGKSFMGAISDIKTGKSTYEDVKSAIDSSIQPEQVKAYMQKLLDDAAPQTEEEGDGRGFWSKLYNWVTFKGWK